MATINETIDIHLPLAEARQKWNEFVNGMIIGSGAAPGEREYPFRWYKEERDAEQGAVQFGLVDDEVTRFTVTLQYAAGDEEESGAHDLERLRGELREDLDLFRRYAEGRLYRAA